jgi:hypothetical protein
MVIDSTRFADFFQLVLVKLLLLRNRGWGKAFCISIPRGCSLPSKMLPSKPNP